MRRSSLRCVLTLSAAALVLAGCEKKPVAARPDSTASTPMAPAGPSVVTVHAKDFAFLAPDSIPAGMTTFKLVNDGPSFHHMQIIRLDSGKTLENMQEAFKKPGPPPPWLAFVGGPNAPDPMSESNATLDMQPGNYALLCLVDQPGGVPHFMKGMAHGLTVTPASTPSVPAPTADVTVTLSDYTFGFSQPLTAGHHVIEVQNAASQPHELELIRLAPGKTGQDFLKWLMKPEGPPPASGIGGSAAIGRGAIVYITVDLTPGSYALICFLPDAKDGKPHFAHGMMQVVVVS